MESSKSCDGEDDADDEGLYVIIVDRKIDEQPKNIENYDPVVLEEEGHKVNEDMKADDESEAMVEEYISKTTNISSDEEKDTAREKCGTRLLPLKKQESFVSELCRTNPQLKDEEALISALCKKMISMKAPHPPDDFMIKRSDNFECGYCGNKIPHETALARHWRERHGPRYLTCLACGADFRCISNLYEHERLCGAPDAWLVLKARKRVKQHRTSGPRTKKENEIEESKPKSRLLKRPTGKRGKGDPRSKKVPKVEESRPAKRPVHKSKKGQLVEESDMPLKVHFVEESEEDCDSDELYELAADEESEKDSGLSCSDDDQPINILKSKAKKPKGRPRKQTVEKSGHVQGSKPQVSYISELCKESSELLQNEELLIDTLSEIMAKEKPSPPPEDFAILNSDMLYECSLCEFADRSEPAAARHWQRRHGPPCFHCYACDAQFRDPASLYRHEKSVCKAKETYVVLKARARSVVWNGRNNRPLTEEPRKTEHYICSFCPREFQRLDSLRVHENKHRDEGTFRCKECPASFTAESSLNTHIEQKHGTGPHVCDKCDRVYTSSTSLKHHMDTHLPEKKFACPDCEKRYVQKFDLNIHINKVHRNLPPPWACKVCPKRYPKMWLLKQHMLQTHGMRVTRKMLQENLPHDEQYLQEALHIDIAGRKKFVCPICGKCSSYKGDLKKHVNQVHRKQPPPAPYECTICPKRYGKKNRAQNHMLKKHGVLFNFTREKSLKKSNQNTIETIKTRIKDGGVSVDADGNDQGALQKAPHKDKAAKQKFACVDCCKQYVNKIDLRNHVTRKHRNLPQPYACKLCPKRYSKMVSLKNHMLQAHGMKIITPRTLLKDLPNLTEEQLKSATIVKKSELNPAQHSDQNTIETIEIDEENTMDTECPAGTRSIIENATPMNYAKIPEATRIDTEMYTGAQDHRDTETVQDEEIDSLHDYVALEDEEGINNDEYFEGADDQDVEGINNDEYYEGTNDGDEEGINNDVYYEGTNVGDEDGINNDVYYERTDDEVEESDEDQETPEDLLEIVMDHGKDSPKQKPMLVIKDGQAVFMNGNSIGYFKKSSNCKYNKKVHLPAKVNEELEEDEISEANRAKRISPTDIQPTIFEGTKVEPKHKYRLRKKK